MSSRIAPRFATPEGFSLFKADDHARPARRAGDGFVMGKRRVRCFSVSLDAFGAGANQDLHVTPFADDAL